MQQKNHTLETGRRIPRKGGQRSGCWLCWGIKVLVSENCYRRGHIRSARVAKLANARALKALVYNDLRVQAPPLAPPVMGLKS